MGYCVDAGSVDHHYAPSQRKITMQVFLSLLHWPPHTLDDRYSFRRQGCGECFSSSCISSVCYYRHFNQESFVMFLLWDHMIHYGMIHLYPLKWMKWMWKICEQTAEEAKAAALYSRLLLFWFLRCREATDWGFVAWVFVIRVLFSKYFE